MTPSRDELLSVLTPEEREVCRKIREAAEGEAARREQAEDELVKRATIATRRAIIDKRLARLAPGGNRIF